MVGVWYCQECDEILSARMDMSIRCANDHVAKGPWVDIISDLLVLRSKLNETEERVKALAKFLEES
jgi:hypothetical protein